MTTVANEPTVRNEVNIDQLYGTLDLLKENPEIGAFQFRVSNTWKGGAHNQSRIKSFYGAGAEDKSRTEEFTIDAGEPEVLLGHDQGANPAEAALHALAACLTTTLVYVCSARGIELDEVSSELEGDIDVRGALGLDDSVRNGFEQVRVHFHVKSSAPAEKVQAAIAQMQRRSVVYDIVTNGVPVTVTAETT